MTFSVMMRLFMKYLPALSLGILLAILSFTSFSLVAQAGYLSNMLNAAPNLSPNRIEFLWLAAHDTGLLILLSGIVLYSYRMLFPKLPFDWFSAALMQMPLGLAVLWLDGINFNLLSFKGVALTLTTLSATFGVLVIFWLLQRRSHRLSQAA